MTVHRSKVICGKCGKEIWNDEWIINGRIIVHISCLKNMGLEP